MRTDLGAWILWFLGYPDQARERGQAALSLAKKLSHPNSLGAALVQTAYVHLYRREVAIVQERAEAAIAFAHEQGLANWLPGGVILKGCALAELEHLEEGMAQMHQGIASLKALGADLVWPQFLALQAQACGKAGYTTEGLWMLAEVEQILQRTGERYFEAELYRLKGELVIQSGVPSPESEAEECFHKSLQIVRHQQAKSWELRTATSLARLWQQQGKKTEAHQLLSEVYNWFTEGFDTADLQDAKALLDDLAEVC